MDGWQPLHLQREELLLHGGVQPAQLGARLADDLLGRQLLDQRRACPGREASSREGEEDTNKNPLDLAITSSSWNSFGL